MSETDEAFLRRVLDTLDELHVGCLEQGRPMLASLIAIARSEAEDEMRSGKADAALQASFAANSLSRFIDTMESRKDRRP